MSAGSVPRISKLEMTTLTAVVTRLRAMARLFQRLAPPWWCCLLMLYEEPSIKQMTPDRTCPSHEPMVKHRRELSTAQPASWSRCWRDRKNKRKKNLESANKRGVLVHAHSLCYMQGFFWVTCSNANVTLLTQPNLYNLTGINFLNFSIHDRNKKVNLVSVSVSLPKFTEIKLVKTLCSSHSCYWVAGKYSFMYLEFFFKGE